MDKKFHFRQNYGLFFGALNQNKPHKHYAVQIGMSLSSAFRLTVDDKIIETNTCFINSNQKHQLINEGNQLTILINPISRIGHYLILKQKEEQGFELNTHLSAAFKKVLENYIRYQSFEKLCLDIHLLLNQSTDDYQKEYYVEDDRILNAIEYLDKNFDRVVSLEEIAATCFLSESRFLHLFKEKTNISFRRYQLWNKIVKSLPVLASQSITTTAHQLGFSDSSHYTRTFKETFGITPKFIASSK